MKCDKLSYEDAQGNTQVNNIEKEVFVPIKIPGCPSRIWKEGNEIYL